jgi:hypothetical protein
MSLMLDYSELLPNWDAKLLEVLLLLDSLVDDLPEDLPEDSSITSSFVFFFLFYLSAFSLACFPISLATMGFSWELRMVFTDPAPPKLYRASRVV